MFQPHPELPGEIVAWYEATLAGKGKPASTPNRARRDSPQDPPPDDDRRARRIRARLETLNAERKKDPKSPILERRFVNFLGYQAIDAGDTKTAVAIMQLNVDGTPSRPTPGTAWATPTSPTASATRRARRPRSR